MQVLYCVKLYSKSAPSNSIFEAGQVQGKGRPQRGGCPPRSLCAPVLWAGSAVRNEPNLIITIDADLPMPQTPPSPPILMRGGMDRPVWCFHPQGGMSALRGSGNGRACSPGIILEHRR